VTELPVVESSQRTWLSGFDNPVAFFMQSAFYEREFIRSHRSFSWHVLTTRWLARQRVFETAGCMEMAAKLSQDTLRSDAAQADR